MMTTTSFIPLNRYPSICVLSNIQDCHSQMDQVPWSQLIQDFCCPQLPIFQPLCLYTV